MLGNAKIVLQSYQKPLPPHSYIYILYFYLMEKDIVIIVHLIVHIQLILGEYLILQVFVSSYWQGSPNQVKWAKF
jgi:hypothetical protein